MYDNIRIFKYEDNNLKNRKFKKLSLEKNKIVLIIRLETKFIAYEDI